MNIKQIIASLFFLTLAFASYAGGGWTKRKGKTYVKISGWWIESKDFFSGTGSSSNSASSSGLFNLNVYAEYGFTDKLTAIAYVPFFSRSYQNDLTTLNTRGAFVEFQKGGELNSFGDSEIGIKYSIYKNAKISLAGSLILGIPLGNDGSNRSNESAVATGDGEFNQLLRIDLGASIYNSNQFSIYGNIYAGYNNRTKGFSDEFRGGLEIGAGLLHQKLWLVSKLDIIESFENGKGFINTSGGSVFANNSEVINIGEEISFYFTKKIGISTSISIPVAGQNIFDAPAYSVGLFFDTK